LCLFPIKLTTTNHPPGELCRSGRGWEQEASDVGLRCVNPTYWLFAFGLLNASVLAAAILPPVKSFTASPIAPIDKLLTAMENYPEKSKPPAQKCYSCNCRNNV
jgi:hypothetical protein